MRRVACSIVGVVFFSFLIGVAIAGPTTISDDRVRSLDIAPVLGRGYSFGTNTFHSSCLVVEETSNPSYNYDYYFTDLTQSSEVESQMHGKISGSFGFGFIKAAISGSVESTGTSTSTYHHVVATMRVERYYSSIMENNAYLSNDAEQLLSEKDYIGFFSACGSNYVRSIRRAMEVTAIFSFKASSESKASKYAADLKVKVFGRSIGGSMSSHQDSKSSDESLTIKIVGFGLALDNEGSSTLVATSLEEYNGVMKHAFKSMTIDQGSGAGRQSGMVYGVEVVPWVDNTAFQVAAAVQDTTILVPIDRGMLPKAAKRGNDETETCADATLIHDTTLRCCEPSELKGATMRKVPSDGTTGDENEDSDDDDEEAEMEPTPGTGLCRPTRPLNRQKMKHTMMTNGEFVAMLDRTLRSKLNTLFELELCVERVRSIPKRYDYQFLKPSDTAKYDAAIDMDYTVKELKMSLDPFNDFGLVKHYSKEVDEYTEMYYSPCLTAILDGSKHSSDYGVDQMFFMASPWYDHAECTHLSCLMENARWDRVNGGCVPNLMSDSNMSEDNDNPSATPEFCATALSETVDDSGTVTTSEKCKHDSNELDNFQKQSKSCWKSLQGQRTGDESSYAVSSYLLEKFCLPQLSDRQASDKVKKSLADLATSCSFTEPTPAT